jgi:hypothetical protein
VDRHVVDVELEGEEHDQRDDHHGGQQEADLADQVACHAALPCRAGAPPARPVADPSNTPVWCEYCPVRMLARDGQHSDVVTNAFENVMPRSTSSDSTFGIVSSWSQR